MWTHDMRVHWGEHGCVRFRSQFYHNYVKCNILLQLDVVQLDSFNGDYGSRGHIVIKLKLTALGP